MCLSLEVVTRWPSGSYSEAPPTLPGPVLTPQEPAEYPACSRGHHGNKVPATKHLTQESFRSPLRSPHRSFGHAKPALVLELLRLPFPLPDTLFPALVWPAPSHHLGHCSKVAASSDALLGHPDTLPYHHSLFHCSLIFSMALATLCNYPSYLFAHV